MQPAAEHAPMEGRTQRPQCCVHPNAARVALPTAMGQRIGFGQATGSKNPHTEGAIEGLRPRPEPGKGLANTASKSSLGMLQYAFDSSQSIIHGE